MADWTSELKQKWDDWFRQENPGEGGLPGYMEHRLSGGGHPHGGGFRMFAEPPGSRDSWEYAHEEVAFRMGRYGYQKPTALATPQFEAQPEQQLYQGQPITQGQPVTQEQPRVQGPTPVVPVAILGQVPEREFAARPSGDMGITRPRAEQLGRRPRRPAPKPLRLPPISDMREPWQEREREAPLGRRPTTRREELPKSIPAQQMGRIPQVARDWRAPLREAEARVSEPTGEMIPTARPPVMGLAPELTPEQEERRLNLREILSLPWTHGLRPLFQGLYQMAKVPERGLFMVGEIAEEQPILSTMLMSGMPGWDLATSSLDLMGFMRQSDESLKDAVLGELQREIEEGPVTIEHLRNAWELGEIGYSLGYDPAKIWFPDADMGKREGFLDPARREETEEQYGLVTEREHAWLMLEADKPMSEILEKHEHLGVELMGNIIIDPVWLIPPAWMEKVLPIGKVLGKAAEGLSKVPGINYLINTTKAGWARTYGYAISDVMDTFMIHMPKDESVGVWLGKMLMGDEEALATLGVRDRHLLTEAATTFKRADAQWRAIITKYSSEVIAGMPPDRKATVMAERARAIEGLAERIIRRTAPGDLAEMEALLERDPRKIGRWIAEGLINLKRRELGLKPIQARGALYRGMSFAAQLWKETILPLNIAFHQVNLLDSTVRMSLRGYFWDPGDLPVLDRVLHTLTGRQPLEARVTAELTELGVTLPRELQTGLIRELLDTEAYQLKTRYAMPRVPVPFIGKPRAIMDAFKAATGNDLVMWAAEASTKGGLRGRIGKLIGAVRFEDASIPIAQAQEMGVGYEYLAKAMNRMNLASLVEAGAENLNIEPLVRITTFWKESEPLFNQARFGVADLIESALLESNPGREAIVQEIAEQVRNPNVVQSVGDLASLIQRYVDDVGPKLDAFSLSYRHIRGNKTLQEVATLTRRVGRKPTTEGALDDIFAYGRNLAEENYSRVVSKVAPEQATVEQLRLAGAPDRLPDEYIERSTQATATIRRAYKRLGQSLKRMEGVRGSDLSFLELGALVRERVYQEVWEPHYLWYNNEYWPNLQAKLDHAKMAGDSFRVSELWTEFRAEIGPRFVKVGEDAVALVDDATRQFLNDVPVDELIKALGVEDIARAVPEERVAEAVGAERLITKIDHGTGGWIAGANDITRTDENAIVALDELLNPERVDIVRQVGEETNRRPGYIKELADSIRTEGFRAKPAVTVAVEQDGSITIIDGTHRIAAAREAGLESIPVEVRYFGLSDEEHLLSYLNAPTAEAVAPEVALPELPKPAEILRQRGVMPGYGPADEAPGLVDRILEQETERVIAEDASLLERATALRDDTLVALREMQEQAIAKFRTAREVAEAVPETLVGLDEIKLDAMRQMADGYEGAVTQGIVTVHELFYDYAARKGIDELLWWASPFTIWQTRNPFGWAKAIAHRPAIVNVMSRVHAFTEAEREERAGAGRFKGTVPIPDEITQPLIDKGIIPDRYYGADVRAFFSIWQQLPILRGDLPWGWEDEPLIGKIVRSGEFIGIRTYPWWQIPLEKLGAYGSVPAGDLTYITKYIRAVTKAAGHEVDIEKPLREWRDRNDQTAIARYYGNLRILQYFFEEEITMEHLVEAVSNPDNPLFGKALGEAADWHFKVGVVRGLETFTIKNASPAEQKARLLQREYFELPLQERAPFREEHPLLVAYWAALRDPEEADASRIRQRRNLHLEMARQVSAAAIAKARLGSKGYEEIIDQRRALLDQVRSLYPGYEEIPPLLLSGLRYQASAFFSLNEDFFDEEGELKDEYSWDQYYDAREAFLKELDWEVPGEPNLPGGRLEFERYLAQNETPSEAILNAWERLYGQMVWDVINAGGDVTAAKRRADQGRKDTQALIAETLRIHPDWTAEQLFEAKKAAGRIVKWDAWARRNKPLRSALESVLWSGYMGLDDLDRKDFRAFIREHPDIDPRIAIVFEEIILPREIEKAQKTWERDMNLVSPKVLLLLAQYLGGLIDLQMEGFQAEIEETEKEYELEPTGEPAEEPEARGRPPGMAVPPEPAPYTPLTEEAMQPGWPYLPQGWGRKPPTEPGTPPGHPIVVAVHNPEQMEQAAKERPAWPGDLLNSEEATAFRDWVFVEAGFTPGARRELEKAELQVNRSAGSGGGWAPWSWSIHLGAPGLEGAIHEYAHAYWEPRRVEQKVGFLEAFMQLAEEKDPQYSEAASLAHLYITGDPESEHFREGMRLPMGETGWTGGAQTGWNDWEMFAGLASRVMGQMEKLPPYIRSFYEGLFGGKTGDLAKMQRSVFSDSWPAIAVTQLLEGGRDRAYQSEVVIQRSLDAGLEVSDLERLFGGDYQEHPIPGIIFAFAHGQFEGVSSEEVRAEWEEIPEEDRRMAVEHFFDVVWPIVKDDPEDWHRVKEFLDYIGIEDAREKQEPSPPEEEPEEEEMTGERYPGGTFVSSRTPQEEAEYGQAQTDMQAWVGGGKEGTWTALMAKWFGKGAERKPLTPEEQAEYNQARVEMQAWEEGGKEGDWTPLMEEWFGRDTPASQFWEFYYDSIPPGKIAEEIRNDPIIQAVLNPETREYWTDEGFKAAQKRLEEWVEKNKGKIPGNPEQWSQIRDFFKLYGMLKDQGRNEEARRLWDKWSNVLQRYGYSRRVERFGRAKPAWAKRKTGSSLPRAAMRPYQYAAKPWPAPQRRTYA